MSTRDRLANLYESYLKKRPRQSRSRLAVESILRAALERLEGAAGEEATLKVEEIAARAGVGVASLYDYFPDRKQLLLGLTAKVTEKNLLDFEALLAEVRPLPLREALTKVVEFAFEKYFRDGRLTRSYVRIAATGDFYPYLVRSQDVIAQVLAADLAKREEVRVEDPDVAAWLLTHNLMGTILTLVVDDQHRIDKERIKAGFVEMAYRYLTNAAT